MIDDRLVHLLGDHLGNDVSLKAPAERISGGYYASIHGFEIDDAPPGWTGPLVLRVMPSTASACKEIVLQRTLAEVGFPTPAVLLDGVDVALGGAFMVMQRARGAMPLSGLSLNRISIAQVRQMRLIPVQLADVALRLHGVERTVVVDALAAAGADDRLGMANYLDLIRAAADEDLPGFAALLDWFDTHLPTRRSSVVCHGDLHPFNLLVDDGSITVLDWTNGNIAPREFDLGFTLAFLTCAPIEVPGALRPVLDLLTKRLCSQFLGRYRKRATVDPVVLEAYEALQYARCLSEVAVARLRPGGPVGDTHPFEISSTSMRRRLLAITGIAVDLPPRP